MQRITYKKSGVDIDKAEAFVRAIGRSISTTLSKNVIKGASAFGSLFAIDKNQYTAPVLVSSADGVGTKVLIAKMLGRHDTIGMDLVAMNVNDILCCGAYPLFFLDYIACGKLDVAVLKDVVKGIAKGCRQAGCSLIGGETAEMPDVYKKDEYDLAGFAVGIVDKNRIIDSRYISKGDIVIGLPSSGLHSNGFSLVRKVLSLKQQKALGPQLLKPTKIYVKEIIPIFEKFSSKGKGKLCALKGIAHITGGAFYEKLTKILPSSMCFEINKKSWPVPEIFTIIQSEGKIEDKEMYRTFNMGIGMVLVFDKHYISAVRKFFNQRRIRFYEIGRVVKKDSNTRIKFLSCTN